MLLKIMTTNEAMKDALLDQSREPEKQGKLGYTNQKWI